ncbi:hypothetical protein NB063_06450 [Rhodopirellula sp. ICT_H3.1]|uniref:Alcohol acetyltransferase n=2 Tax=Aporhodopirellula aestuarii TaxID=2950107 RepID=A0ABT0U037_9BACT|nr:hypothetical protein [Aporhodopirellula aestuarii]
MFEHCAAYPCYCFIRLHFDGRLDRSSLTIAMHAALQHHPLLRAIIKTGWGKRWSFPDDTEPSIIWREGTTGGPLPPAADIDLFREPGLKTFVVRDNTKTELTLQFHHACCDGNGIARFIEDVMVNYARVCENGPGCDHPPTVDVSSLATRGAYGLRFWSTLKILPGQLVGLLGAIQFWGRKPKSVIAHQARSRDQSSPSPYPSLAAFRFDKANTLALRKAAIEQNVSLNELLIRDFFLALWKWQQDHDQYNDQHWIRLMIPIDMRNKSYRSLPAMNQVSSIFLDRRGSDRTDRDQLLRSIRDEMAVIRKFQLRYTFLFFINALHRIPTALRKSVQRDECKTSAIFSCVRKALWRDSLPRQDGFVRVGDTTIVDIDGLAPIRPHNCLTMLTVKYAHRLKLNLHYDADFVTPAQADELMHLFVSNLNETAHPSDP